MTTIKPKSVKTGKALNVTADTEAERFLLLSLRRLNDDTMDMFTKLIALRLARLPKRPSLRVISGGAQ
jgi:hypothetical protein